MEIKGVPLDDFRAIVDHVSRTMYGGNLITHKDAKDLHGVRTPRIRARVGVLSSRAPGARRSWTGRRMPAACWHAYRDVLAELFHRFPAAVVRTGMEKYDGAAGFLANYPQTGRRNIGSAFQPATMPELCDCHDTRSVAEVAEYVGTTPGTAEVAQALLTPDAVGAGAALRVAADLARTPHVRSDDDGRWNTALAARAEDAINEANALLAEVAAEGWTNPYTDPDSPAHRLARA